MSKEEKGDIFFDNEENCKRFLEQHQKDTIQEILRLISKYNPAMIYSIAFDVLKKVYTEKEIHKTFFKEDGTERTDKEILAELMYEYGVGTTENKAYFINTKYWETLTKATTCFEPDCDIPTNLKCLNCSKPVCKIHIRGKYCNDCTKEGD